MHRIINGGVPDLSRRNLLLAGAGLTLTGAARAQLPHKNLSLVVGFPAGGPADTAARLMAEALRAHLQVTVLVENRPGAGGRIAIEYVKNGEADGSNLLMVPGTTMTLSPHLYKQLGYDPQRDFAPVAHAFGADLALAVGPAVPASVRTVADFVQWGRAHPEQLFFGVGAQGSLTHYIGIMFAKAAGVNFTYIPYKGGTEVMRDVLSGLIATTVLVQSEAMTPVQSGKLRVLATTGSHRSLLQPDIPTLKESGVNVESASWFGFYVSSRCAPATVQSLALAIAAAQKNPAVVRGFTDIGYAISPSTPASFADFTRNEHQRWAPIVKAAGIVLE